MKNTSFRNFTKHVLVACALVFFATYGGLPAKVARSGLVGMCIEKIVGSLSPLVSMGRLLVGLTLLVLMLIGAWEHIKKALAESTNTVGEIFGAPIDWTLNWAEKLTERPLVKIWLRGATCLFLLMLVVWYFSA